MLDSGVSGQLVPQFVMVGPKAEIGLDQFLNMNFYLCRLQDKLADAKNEGETCADNPLRVLSLVDSTRCNE